MISIKRWRYHVFKGYTLQQTVYFKGVFILWIIPVYIVCEKVEYYI